MAASLPRYRFTADDYQAMGRAGIIPAETSVELIDGEVVEMSPIGSRHAYSVTLLTEHLASQGGGEALLLVRNPIHLGERDEPQPDLALVRRADYRERLPTAADLFLVIEVADTSRDRDRGTKFPRYAEAGIPEAWLVDLVGGLLERQSVPRDGFYRQIALARPGEVLASGVWPSLSIPVNLALGAA